MLSLVYLLISPAALIYLRKNYTKVVKVATVMAASASIGRSLTGDDQILNLIMTAVLSVAFMPIVVAPFGLLDLFAYSEISYAASIPLLLPSIGNSLCQVFRSSYITEITDQLEGQHLAQSQSDDWSKTLAIILAVISTVSAIASYLLLNELKG